MDVRGLGFRVVLGLKALGFKVQDLFGLTVSE